MVESVENPEFTVDIEYANLDKINYKEETGIFNIKGNSHVKKV